MSSLDRPVWSSLTTTQAGLSVGDQLARRYASDVNAFASARDDSPAALERLAGLVGLGEQVFVLQVPLVAVPPGLAVVKEALGVQMVDGGARLPGGGGDAIVPLGDGDAAEMLTLAAVTEPGPFLPQTHRMGQFFGVRVDGRLVAMAGERMRFPGYAEVSGVCTHPDHRSQGLARRLSIRVMSSIRARGETPFLHAWKTNVTAIRLYESLGFAYRCDVRVVVLARR